MCDIVVSEAPPGEDTDTVDCVGSAAAMEDLARQNYFLREKLREVTSDRDRLLCEVANLRLELDMAELKRLPDDNCKSQKRQLMILQTLAGRHMEFIGPIHTFIHSLLIISAANKNQLHHVLKK
ncbi:uncharacterized protein DMENIID0001_022470 [Sergentomyia squamirostris]